MYNRLSKVSCDFSSYFIKRFIFSLTELKTGCSKTECSKTGCSKIGSMFVSTLFLCTLKINMDKTSQEVKKYPKRQERGKKSHETYMKRLKEKILEDNQDKPTPPDSSPTGDPMPCCPCHWCLCIF